VVGSLDGGRGRVVAALGIAAVVAACQAAPAGTPATQSSQAPASNVAASDAPPSPTPHPTLPNGRVVFTRYAGNPEGPFLGFYVLAAGESKSTKVDLPIEVEGGGLPAWSRDGSQLVVNLYSGAFGGRPGVIKPDGTAFQLLQPAGLAADLECTDWSPDGKRLLCDVGSNDPKVPGIFEMTIETQKLDRLTHSPYHYTEGSEGGCGGGDSRAVYSPDGKQFAFIRQKCGTGPRPDADEEAALVVGDIATQKLKVVVERGLRTHAGSQIGWSPDGAWLVYGTQSLGLGVVRPDGTDGHLLPVDVPGVMGPTWSPDGSSILFARLSNGQLGTMYLVAADGSGATLVPGTSGGAFPRWTSS
jgi:Tol biopolymer transport system component